ncbi:MAG: EAL domain-containing protein [Coleofasciculaceae cyanobacterium SM2_3_26]|nr:EAL domain-containing protein [Coleofasciculaceae cyanobacterium SM2_3_26]
MAEGIETIQQMEQLQRFGCEYGQGYLFARPMDAAATERAIANESWRL